MLQALIWDGKYVDQAVMYQVKTMKSLLDVAISMNDAHAVLTLVRSCFGACRLYYTPRVVPSTLEMRGAV